MYILDEYTAKAIKNGNLPEMEKAYNCLYQSVYHYIQSYIPNREDAREITQDCFLTLWEKRENLSDKTNLKTFLLHIARNKSLNYLERRQARRNYTEQMQRELFVNYAALRDKSAELVLLQELETIITNTLNSFPEPYRSVFEMSRNDELTYQEIARQLGISVKTVEYRMSYCLRIFRKRLQPFLPLALVLTGYL